MNRSFLLGSLAMLGGLFLLVMRTLARLMPGDPNRFDYSFETLLDPGHLAWIDTLSSPRLQDMASSVVGAPLYVCCFALGFLLILWSGMRKD